VQGEAPEMPAECRFQVQMSAAADELFFVKRRGGETISFYY